MRPPLNRHSALRRACTSPAFAAIADSSPHGGGDSRKATKFPRSRAGRKAKTLRDFSSADVGKGSSLLFDNQMPETLILARFQPRIGRKDRHPPRPRAPHQIRLTLAIPVL